MADITSCAIVIPIYKSVLTEYETFSLRRIMDVFHDYSVVFLLSEDMDEDIFIEIFGNVFVVKIESKHFGGFASYNKLMLSTFFYDLWLQHGYEAILICQLDVFVIKDDLVKFLSMPYDYFGAPLVHLNHIGQPVLYGGNGGFSLRHLQVCRRLLSNHIFEAEAWRENEDEFFSFCGESYPDEFKIAPPYIAATFAYDRFSKFLHVWQHGAFPFALHGWYNYDIDFSRKLLRQIGVEGTPFLRTIGYSERLRELNSFLENAESIFIYGAGIWGKAFARYFLSQGVFVSGILVSDHVSITEKEIFDIPVCHVGEWVHAAREIAVVMAMSKRAMADGEYMAIKGNLLKLGIKSIFLADVILFNYVMEQWLFSVYK